MKKTLIKLSAAAAFTVGLASGREVLLAPSAESVFRTGASITITASCTNESTPVEFFADGLLLGRSDCAAGNASFVWVGSSAGVHALSAGISEPLIVFVNDRAAKAPMESVRGTVQEVIEERFETRTSRIHYSLVSNGVYTPIVAVGPPIRAAARSGRLVTLNGYRSSGRFYPRQEAFAEQESENAAAPLAALGVRNVVIIPITFSNATQVVIDKTTASQLVDPLKQYYQEASYGMFSLAVDVVGPVALSVNETCNDNGDVGNPNGAFDSITNAGVQAAKAAGINLSKYQSYVFIGPTATQCGGGLATIGGTPGIVLQRFNLESYEPDLVSLESNLTAHELGHNLGLYHPHAYDCTNVIYNPAASCGVVEYGDLFDVMGAPSFQGYSPHFNAAYKELLGWLTSQTVTGSGIFKVLPFETAPTGRSLRIVPPSASDSFYVEYRQPLGFDSAIGREGNALSRVFSGALIHLSGNSAFILNVHPADISSGTPYPLDPSLHPGETYVDYANRFSVTTLSTAPSSLGIQILIATTTTPTALFQSPADGSTVGGVAQVSVGALDRSGISKVELYRDGALLGTATTTPYSFNWDTTKDPTGSHKLTATAYNKVAATYSTSIHVAVHRLPTISLIAPASLAVQAGQAINLSAQTTVEAGATAAIEFFANGASIGLATLSGTGVEALNWTPTTTGTFAISAIVTDSNGLSATSPTVNLTVASIAITSVQTAFGGPDIAQNAWIQINGFGLAPAALPATGLTWSSAPDFASGRMPTQLEAVSVTVNGKPAYIYFISPTQVNVLTPLDSNIGPVQVTLTNGLGNLSAPVTVNLRANALSLPLIGGNYVAAIHLDGSDVGPASLYPGLTSPAKPGETIVVYGFGFGLPTTPLVNGSAVQSGALPNLPAIKIGSIDAVVSFAGLVSPGLYQFNVTVPEAAPDGDNLIVAAYAGLSTPPANLIAIQH